MQIITKEVRLILFFICQGNGAVEGICLDMTQITYMNLSSNAFRKMSNLRLLAFKSYQDFEIINSVYLPKGLECLHKSLRYFEWDGYPLESLPSTFCSEKLVEFSMPYSNVKKLWHGVQVHMIHISITRQDPY